MVTYIEASMNRHIHKQSKEVIFYARERYGEGVQCVKSARTIQRPPLPEGVVQREAGPSGPEQTDLVKRQRGVEPCGNCWLSIRLYS